VSIPRRSRSEQADDVRKRLLAAARTVFMRDGYHGATLDEVVRVAGFSKGVVYSRFESKAELFLALLEERIALRAAELPAAAREGEGGDGMFRQWFARTHNEEAWALVVLEFRIAAARDPALNRRYAALHDRVVAAVAEQLRQHPLALPAEHAARIGLGYSNGILLERVAAGGKLPDESIIFGNAALYKAIKS
jgi:AcrR family transcriptional regulator